MFKVSAFCVDASTQSLAAEAGDIFSDRFLLQLVPYHQKPYLQLFYGCGFRLLFAQYNDV